MIFSSNVLKRWSFQKSSTGIWSISLYYLERWYFSFPKISSYLLEGKRKMIFLKKINENTIVSSNVLKWWSFQKSSRGIWSIFLHYLERWYFSFPKISSYLLEGKWKMIFLKKINENMIFSSNAPKRWSFQKRLRWNRSFLYYLERRWYCFFPENMIFFEPKMKDDLSQEIHGSMIIFVYMYQCYKYGITLLQ